MQFTKFLFVVPILVALGVAQSTDLLNFFGAKPNFLLVMMIALIFFTANILDYFALTLIAVILTGIQSGLSLEQLALAGISLLAFLIAQKIHWHPFFTNLVFIISGTFIFYILSEPAFILAYPKVIILEIFYNLILGILLFKIIKDIFKREFSLKD